MSADGSGYVKLPATAVLHKGNELRTLLTRLLLIVAGLPALLSQAQTVDICDRTSQVRDAILQALEADDCAAVDSEGMAGVETLDLRSKGLTALQAGDFDGLTGLRNLTLRGNQLTALPDGVFNGPTNLQNLLLDDNQFASLPAGMFNGLASLQGLGLGGNQLTTLPDSVFDSLTSLRQLYLNNNEFTTLPADVFNGLTGLQTLSLPENPLTALPDGVFHGLTSLQELVLERNQLTSLPAGVFDDVASLQDLGLDGNQLTTLPDGVFDGLTSLQRLWLNDNRLTVLPDSLFDGLTSLQALSLHENQLAALPAGVFDSLTSLQELWLNSNRLTSLREGVFDSLTSLALLDLRYNRLVGLTRDDPLFAGFSSSVDIRLDGQTGMRLVAAVPLMLSAADSMRQGFVRIVNESEESGNVRVFAFDDGGHAPDPFVIRLGAGQTVHFNSNNLEDGNADKGIAVGIGNPMQGDWRLDVETALTVRVMAFVRTTAGFLTAMHDVLPRDAEGRLVAQTFNPGSNMNQESKLRLVNTGENAESVSIEGVDDQGANAGPVTLTLPRRQSRTLPAFDLENGAPGLTGTLGDGTGKWRLFITAGDSVVGMSLLDAVSGHLTNISTTGVATEASNRPSS